MAQEQTRDAVLKASRLALESPTIGIEQNCVQAHGRTIRCNVHILLYAGLCGMFHPRFANSDM